MINQVGLKQKKNIEHRVYELVRPYAAIYLFNLKKVELTPDTDLDTDLSIDETKVEDLMNDFFREFNVERENFKIETYYTSAPLSWNPFRKSPPIPVPDFTIRIAYRISKGWALVI